MEGKQMKFVKRLEIRLEPKLFEELKNKAKDLGVSMSQIVRPGIDYAIRNARSKGDQ
jgi:post-segregation antitoxin (ccd killing protein)